MEDRMQIRDIRTRRQENGLVAAFARRSARMDPTVLVNTDRVIQAQVLDALDRARIPVTLCEWNYEPEHREWELIIATPRYDTKGPHLAFRAVIDALEKAGVYRKV